MTHNIKNNIHLLIFTIYVMVVQSNDYFECLHHDTDMSEILHEKFIENIDDRAAQAIGVGAVAYDSGLESISGSGSGVVTTEGISIMELVLKNAFSYSS